MSDPQLWRGYGRRHLAWSPGVNVGQSMPFVDNCYLLKHAQGWMLSDTGVSDAIAAMPDGQKPTDPKATHWYRPQTLTSQLEALGVQPADITFVAVSHTHGDHIGNVELFPQAMLLVQQAEYDWPGINNAPRFTPAHPVTTLAGDKDVFGDGSVTILSTPGHTPGHQSLLVKLPQTGALVLSGDAVHFQANWEHRGGAIDERRPGEQTKGVDGAHRGDTGAGKRRRSGSTMTRRSATACRWRRDCTSKARRGLGHAQATELARRAHRPP